MATAEELRRLREEQSIFSALYDMARQQQSELAAEGRRPVLGGLLSKEPVYGTDTLRYEGIGNMLVGLLSPAAKAVDAPISAYRGTIPQEDMISEALGVGGLAMLGGGAVGVPRGAVGANALRGDKFFAQDEIDIYTRQARNPKSRETLTYMSPQDFLALAKKTTAGEKTEKTRKLLREGTQFESIPLLSVQNQGGGNAKVVGHEGRNRMMVLAEAGVESVPVRLNMTGGGSGPSIRWGEALDPNSFDYVDPKDIPVRVINEDENMVYSMPDSVVSPITQAAAPSSDLLPLGGYRKPERRLSKEEQDIEDQINESILFDILRDYDTTAANASKSAGLLTSSAADLRRQANIERFGYDPNETPEVSGFDAYLRRVNPSDKRIPEENRPNLRMGDMYGMLPRDAEYVSNIGSADIYRTPDGSYYATAYNPDLGEMDVVGYAIKGDKETDLQVVSEMQGKGIGGELQYLFRKENPDAPTGGLTEAGEASLLKTYNKLRDDGVVAANASKSAGLLTTAASEAQDMAKRILDLRAQGRASEVTDEMMAQADPQYMFANTPLPMDEASRMARAEAAGFEGDLFHGGKGGYDIMRTDAGTGKTSGTGAFLTPSNKLAETYSPVVDGSVYPLMSRSSAPIVNADMQNWNNIESPVYAFNPKTMDDIEVIDEYGRASTDDIAREARKISEAIEIQDVSDRGPRAWGMTQYPAVSNVRVEYNPANIRSRFARFDPEFAHLSNLSAANASPLGGLLAQSGVSDKQAERIEEYLRRRGLLD